ncbi:neural proliferation differentiation and control protein 1 [Chanos chanos]|uniref:Neural proliferation differentiation and control protein 1 n=1 Tax=Chanos chanos TaxID=29144 RepID=A0A6J2WTN4_CHACN|nr:neural proliferation differentiation and control protein 1 [Chanos chanos]
MTLAVSATLAAVGQCPRSLDCAREGRHFCQPGSSHCGPCLSPLVENKRGKCVVRRRSHINKATSFPELDEEIDFLSSIITKHKESEVKHSESPSQVAPKAKEGFSQQRTYAQTGPTLIQVTTGQPTTGIPTTSPPTAVPTAVHISDVQSEAVIIPYPSDDHSFLIMTGVFFIMASVALVFAGICWVRLQKGMRLTQKVDYPAFGAIGPHSYAASSGDKKLAQSAQMYHYQHQKQQMLSLRHRDEPKIPESGTTSDEENEDGDFTVYECPGLAPTGEMEVKNPLFDDSGLHLHLQKSYN